MNNLKDTNWHVFPVVTKEMNRGVMQVIFKMKDYNGVHVEVNAVRITCS